MARGPLIASVCWSILTVAVACRAPDQQPAFTPTAKPTPFGQTEVPAVHLVPPPATNGPPPGLSDIDFASSSDGFAVTGGGGIFASTDAGANWRVLHQQHGASFRTVQALNTTTAIVIGTERCSRSSSCSDPILLRTTNGGRSWDVLRPDLADADAAGAWWDLDVMFASPEVGYAVRNPDTESLAPRKGIDGKLFATRDGGRHWHALALPVGVRPSGGLSVLDAEHVYITSGSDVFASGDAGASWQSLHADAPLSLSAVQFIDAEHGVAAGGESWYPDGHPGRQLVLATDDSGQHWAVRFQREFPLNAYVLRFARVRFGSPSTGWVAGGGCYKFGMNGPCPGPLLFTNDGGRTWADSGMAVERFAATGSRAWTVRDNPRAGVSGGFLARTDDAGTTWLNLWQPTTLVIRNFQLLDAHTGWMDTNVGFFKTTDGGEHWASSAVRLPGSTGSSPNAEPLFVTEVTAFAFGPATAISTEVDLLRSDDGGYTWRAVALPVSRTGDGGADVRAGWVTFADPQHGWVSLPTWCRGTGHCPELLLATTDGGATWIALQPGLPPHAQSDGLVQLTFGDRQNGAALSGYPPRLALTHDGGQTWQAATQPGQITYAGGRTVWVLGDHLHRSDDGGQTWTEQDLGSILPTRVQFVNRADGWMTISQSGTFLVTHDGGHTWQQVWPQVEQGSVPAGPQR